MEALEGVGNVVGEYVGDGQGESENDMQAANLDVVDDHDMQAARFLDVLDAHQEDHDMQAANLFDVVDAHLEDNEQAEVRSDDAHPLFFLYDCESTGLSIYNDHIIEIAAEVVNSPVINGSTTFASLVKTSRRIPAPGKTPVKSEQFLIRSLVTKITNITPTMIRGERPLSVVLKVFLEWLISTTSTINSATGTPHYPGWQLRLQTFP